MSEETKTARERVERALGYLDEVDSCLSFDGTKATTDARHALAEYETALRAADRMADSYGQGWYKVGCSNETLEVVIAYRTARARTAGGAE